MSTDHVPLHLTAETMPTALRICGASEDFRLDVEAAGTGASALKKFSITGYTGGMMRPSGYYGASVVVDLVGMKVPRQDIPALYGHNAGSIVGHTTAIEASQQRLKLVGVLSGYSDTEQTPGAVAAREIVRLGKNGFAWQASLGADVEKQTFVPAGESFKSNGRVFNGPAYHITASTLREISIVPLGADGNTSTDVSAQRSRSMNFEQWLVSKGIDAAVVAANSALKSVLEAQHRAEANPATPPPAVTPPSPPPVPTPVQAGPAVAPSVSFDQAMAAIEAESARQVYIRERTVNAARQYVGNPERLKQLNELCTAALADQKMDQRAYDMALIRFDRAIGPTLIVAHSGQQALNEQVLEAAICQTSQLAGIEKHFSDQVLQAAHTRFRRGIGLKELLLIAAERNNNYRGSLRDDVALCRAAFRYEGSDSYGLRADVGPSTIAVPGILSNVANKFLAAGFLYTEQSHKQIARIRTATDFKTMTTYRLTGSNTFVKIAPGGEIKHGTLSELSYTNAVDSYGILLGLDRRDIRNDDLGAFTDTSKELGRGGGDSLNNIFWAEWLDDSAFFPTDKSNANYDDGATDSVLSLAGLDNAETILRKQTKPDGTPLGAMPTVLLVPAALYNTALQLMGSQGLVVGTTPASGPNGNVFAGRYRVVSSVYLDASSSTAWYLAVDPNNIAAIELAFLDGIMTPTVETSEFDLDRLGMAMRAYMDFGTTKQEYRAAVKLKGAA